MVAVNAEPLGGVCVAERISAASMVRWIPENKYMVYGRDEAHRWWNVSTLSRWSFPNKILAEQLGSLGFVMPETNLLGSKLGGSQLMSTPKALSAISRRSLINLL